ncbi:MAG: response regulator transcription factor [Luteolibacter sp.]
MQSSSSSILIIDPYPIIREGMACVLSGLDGVSVDVSSDFPEALDRLRARGAELVITDFRIRGDNVLSFLRELPVVCSRTRCLIVSALDEIQIGCPTILAGASGFITKSEPVAKVLDAVRMILAGNSYCSERLSRALMSQQSHGMHTIPGVHLTGRELQIFSLFGECLPVSAIAARLGVSVKTIEAHRENIKNKLSYQNSAQVIAAAVRWLDDSFVDS